MVNPRDDIRIEFEGADFELPGWPGYRTRPGRSGYDPLDSSFERTQLVGRVIISLLKQDWHTDSLVHLILLNIFGLLSLFVPLLMLIDIFVPLLLALIELGSLGSAILIGIILVIYLIIGFGFREIDAIVEDELPES